MARLIQGPIGMQTCPEGRHLRNPAHFASLQAFTPGKLIFTGSPHRSQPPDISPKAKAAAINTNARTRQLPTPPASVPATAVVSDAGAEGASPAQAAQSAPPRTQKVAQWA
ncbi:MAG: hypothetical protein KDJ20_04120, partial [Hyphomicrobiales bacterium]|nr:hypothetical protein [Hyphomicrobiales bacterium]